MFSGGTTRCHGSNTRTHAEPQPGPDAHPEPLWLACSCPHHHGHLGEVYTNASVIGLQAGLRKDPGRPPWVSLDPGHPGFGYIFRRHMDNQTRNAIPGANSLAQMDPCLQRNTYQQFWWALLMIGPDTRQQTGPRLCWPALPLLEGNFKNSRDAIPWWSSD